MCSSDWPRSCIQTSELWLIQNISKLWFWRCTIGRQLPSTANFRLYLVSWTLHSMDIPTIHGSQGHSKACKPHTSRPRTWRLLEERSHYFCDPQQTQSVLYIPDNCYPMLSESSLKSLGHIHHDGPWWTIVELFLFSKMGRPTQRVFAQCACCSVAGMASKYQPWEPFHQHVTLWESIIFLDASMILPFNCPFALGISQLITRLLF